jgi:RNA polymerase sigma-70 factor (ECF subfamily)
MVTSQQKYTELTALFCEGLRGNHTAYAQFLRSITPMLRRTIARKIAISDVEDVVQEVLISIHKARHTYDGVRPLMPWLTAIIHFRIMDHMRKHYAEMRHQTCDIADVEHSLFAVTEDEYDNESIDALLQDVPLKQKAILTMMHVQGFTAKEIGQKMNMNESAVKVAAHRAMKKIRETFAT